MASLNEVSPIKEAEMKIINSPIRFATPDALKKCSPKLYLFMENSLVKKRDSGIYKNDQVTTHSIALNSIPDDLNEGTMKCIYDFTVKNLDDNAGSHASFYDNHIKEAQKYLGIAKSKKGVKSRGRNNNQRHQAQKKAERALGKGILHAIVEDPISYSRYLMEDGDSEDLSNICLSLKESLFKHYEYQEAKNTKFAVASGAALGFAAAGIFFTGPVGWGLLGASLATAFVENRMYSAKGDDYQNLNNAKQVTNLSLSVNRSVKNNELMKELRSHIDEFNKLDDKVDSARFWQYFTAASGGFAAVGGSLKGLVHLSHLTDSASKTKSEIIASGPLAKVIKAATATEVAKDISRMYLSLAKAFGKTSLGAKGGVFTNKIFKFLRDPKYAKLFNKATHGNKESIDALIHAAHEALEVGEKFAIVPGEILSASYLVVDYTQAAIFFGAAKRLYDLNNKSQAEAYE